MTRDERHEAMMARCAEALRHRREGKTYAAIGAIMGVSGVRARQLVMNGLPLERRAQGIPWRWQLVPQGMPMQ
jgi:DNA-binding CsgD family transcriptional regulator